MKTGTVRVKGPMTKEDQVVWNQLRERKQECDREIAEMEELLRKEPDYPHRQFVLDEIEHERKIRATISKAIPD